MLTKFKVTYSNNGKLCTLPLSVTNIFADSEEEAKQLCEDLYSKTKDFYIASIEHSERSL